MAESGNIKGADGQAHPAGVCEYETLLANIPGAAYRCLPDKAWTMLFITENIRRLSGYPPGDFLKNAVRTFASIIHPDDAAYVRDSINSSVAAGASWKLEYRILHKDGSIRWVYEEGSGIKDADGKTAWLDGIILDITEHKRLEKAHMRAEARLSATLSSIGDGVISTGPSGIVTSMNKMAERLTGYSSGEASGKAVGDIFRIFDTESRRPLENPMEASVREGRAVNFTGNTSLITRGGDEIQIADSCAPIRDARGEVIGAVLVFRDVSEEYRARKKEEFEMRFQRTVADVSARFINVSDKEFDSAVDSSLAYLGRLFDVDRSYLFRVSEDLETMDNTHEWCAEGVAPHKDRIQNYPLERMAWFKDEMLKLQPVHIPDVDALPPEAQAEKEEFKAQSIQSLICLPFRNDAGRLIGFMGFDTVGGARTWSENHILILQVVAEIIAGAILRINAYRELRKSESRFNELAKQGMIIFWEVDHEGVYTYMSDAAEEITGYKPGELVGKKHFYDLSPEEDTAGAKESGLAVMRKKETLYNSESRMVRKDGRVIRVISSGGPVLNPDGSLKGYRGLDVCIEGCGADGA